MPQPKKVLQTKRKALGPWPSLICVFFFVCLKAPTFQPRTPNLEPMADNGPLKDAGVGSPSWSPKLTRLDHGSLITSGKR